MVRLCSILLDFVWLYRELLKSCSALFDFSGHVSTLFDFIGHCLILTGIYETVLINGAARKSFVESIVENLPAANLNIIQKYIYIYLLFILVLW